MKGQLSLEFVVILLLLTSYLSVVFSLFSSAKAGLEGAVDKKAAERLERWADFIAQRPEGTEIRLDFNAPPLGFIGIECGRVLRVSTRSKVFESDIVSVCKDILIEDAVRLAIKRGRGEVEIEIV